MGELLLTVYTPPVAEQLFVLDTIADLPGLATLPGYEAATGDMVETILNEATKLSAEIFAPLNRSGDTEGARLGADSKVRLPDGFADAYRQYAAGGWTGLAASPAHGGQGMPFALDLAVHEQFTSANMAFSLNMTLTAGAIQAITAHASPELKALYLPRMISGEWTGTMNLTEPQAGSDVGAARTMATPAGDGTWRIKGQKIYITWGEHDLAPNIVHLVLARTPGAPAGTRGLSLFIVPKVLVNADGSLGAQNDVRCARLEEKMGLHASPTCEMHYGDNDACIGWLVGEVNGGIRGMFTMMNHARITVGLQGIAVAERATQAAFAYARERVQMGPIINHPDVQRMLMTAQATTEAARALAYYNAAAVDRGHNGVSDADRAAGQGLADLLTPMTKAYSTDIGSEVTSLAIQVHGGMGYMEETGVAQHYRDVRIAAIYEGTNGIQAMDLVGRKLAADDGRHWRALIAAIATFAAAHPAWGGLTAATTALSQSSEHLATADPRDKGAVAALYLRQFAVTVGAWLLARQAVEAEKRLAQSHGDPRFLKRKIASARFYHDQLLPQIVSFTGPILTGAAALPDMDLFAA